MRRGFGIKQYMGTRENFLKIEETWGCLLPETKKSKEGKVEDTGDSRWNKILRW